MNIEQAITFDPLDKDTITGNITNTIKFSSPYHAGPMAVSPTESPTIQLITGKLAIHNNHSITSAGDMLMTLEGHYLTPDNDIPGDIEQFLINIQRSMPIDLFDPTDLYLKHTYIDPAVRIVRVGSVSRGLTSIIHIFCRE